MILQIKAGIKYEEEQQLTRNQNIFGDGCAQSKAALG